MQAIFETLFDIVYLVTVITLGIVMIRGSKGRKQYLLYGIMAVTLGCGDAFHLVPRAVALCTTGLESYTTALGVGKLITSITMTLFYVLLYYVWRSRYRVDGQKGTSVAVWLLALLRIVLCLMPQNTWTSAAPPLSWGILRNIPFTFLGVLIVVLFYRIARETKDRRFRYLRLAGAHIRNGNPAFPVRFLQVVWHRFLWFYPALHSGALSRSPQDLLPWFQAKRNPPDTLSGSSEHWDGSSLQSVLSLPET